MYYINHLKNLLKFIYKKGFVFQRGKLITPLKQIIKDVKDTMYPYVAMKLRVY